MADTGNFESEPEPQLVQLVSVEEREKQRILECVEYWQYKASLGNISINNVFDETTYDPESDEEEEYAEVQVEWKYNRSTITWYHNNTVNLSKQELTKQMFHEFGHILLGALDIFIPDDETWLSERSATEIGESLYALASLNENFEDYPEKSIAEQKLSNDDDRIA